LIAADNRARALIIAARLFANVAVQFVLDVGQSLAFDRINL
jgi:hypothetical protein